MTRNRAAIADLLPFCITDWQRRVVDTCAEHGPRGAARILERNHRSIERTLEALRYRAAVQGHSPEHGMTHAAPDSHVVKGVSTLYVNGVQSAQWVKTDLRREAMTRLMAEAVEAFREDIPKAKPARGPKAANADLLNTYVITDYHIGCRGWPEETKDDPWDTDIAEDLLVAWFSEAISRSPDAETAVLAQLGDAVHYDGLNAVTPTGGHNLDSDTRFQRMVRVVIRVFRRVISMLLEKHARVHVIMAEGNHDIASSAWLREVFSAFYEHEPRVTVDQSPDPYYCVEHGQTAVFFHHGHMKKMEQIDRVFVAKFREAFGRTKHAVAHMGHYHHRRELESSLMVVRQHRTLAASDAYASRGGYLSGREAQVITYHKRYGEVGSLSISPEMVRGTHTAYGQTNGRKRNGC